MIIALSIILPSIKILEQMISNGNYRFEQYWEELKRFDFRIGALYAFISISITIILERFNGHNFFKTPINSGINIGKSKYDYWHLAKKANKQIILCGQNHYYLSIKKINEFTESIKELQSKEVEVIMLMDDVRFIETSIAWLTVNAPNFNYLKNYKAFDKEKLKQNEYFNQLIKATSNLYELQSKCPNFKVLTKPHVPISMTFVDPEEHDGFIVIPQNFFNYKHINRPYFLVHKKWSKEVFDSYWDIFSQDVNLEETLPIITEKKTDNGKLISFGKDLSIIIGPDDNIIDDIIFKGNDL